MHSCNMEYAVEKFWTLFKLHLDNNVRFTFIFLIITTYYNGYYILRKGSNSQSENSLYNLFFFFVCCLCGGPFFVSGGNFMHSLAQNNNVFLPCKTVNVDNKKFHYHYDTLSPGATGYTSHISQK